MDSRSKSLSIHTRPEITTKYEVLERVGGGAFCDVYRGRRLSDGVIVALKQVHDNLSASQEIEALQVLQGSKNVIFMHEYFWRKGEDAVLILEFLRTDLATVIKEAAADNAGGLAVGELKRWMVQVLSGVHACHQNMIVHRHLNPANLLISDDGVLKIANFRQARILADLGLGPTVENPPPPYELDASNLDNMIQTGFGNEEEGMISHEDYIVLYEITDQNIPDGNTPFLDDGDDLYYNVPYEADEHYRAPELLYGAKKYGMEIDIWSLGCIFAELLALKPLFSGSDDIDQLSRFFSVLGNINEEVWPGCSTLPNYERIWFIEVDNGTGLEASLPNRTAGEVSLIKRLVVYDPAMRATAEELLHDKYFSDEPLPIPISELRVPLPRNEQEPRVTSGRQ